MSTPDSATGWTLQEAFDWSEGERGRLAAENLMLYDALIGLFEVVRSQLDPDPPEGIEHVDQYLNWNADRGGRLRALIARQQEDRAAFKAAIEGERAGSESSREGRDAQAGT